MKFTNRELINKVNIIKKLMDKQLSVKGSYSIAKNINNINKELELFDSEKMKLINQYTEKDENGENKIKDNTIVLIKGKEDECNEKYSELLNIETDIEIRKINIDDLEGVKISPSELMELDFMLSE